MAVVPCNEIAQKALELQMKFKNCTILYADDLDDLVDLMLSIQSCIVGGGSIIGDLNVQSDWNENDNTLDSFILNKPDISNYTHTGEVIGDVDLSLHKTSITNKIEPSDVKLENITFLVSDKLDDDQLKKLKAINIPFPKSNWTEENSSSHSYIANKIVEFNNLGQTLKGNGILTVNSTDIDMMNFSSYTVEPIISDKVINFTNLVSNKPIQLFITGSTFSYSFTKNNSSIDYGISSLLIENGKKYRVEFVINGDGFSEINQKELIP